MRRALCLLACLLHPSAALAQRVSAGPGPQPKALSTSIVFAPDADPVHVLCDAGTCGGSSAFLDRSTFVFGSTAINVFAGVFDDTPPAALTTGQSGAARMTAYRAVHFNLRDSSGNELGLSAAPVFVNCVNCGGGSAPVLMADAMANPTLSQLAVFPMLYNGTTWDRARGDTTAGAWVNVKNASLAVTGTFFQATQPVSIASTVNVDITDRAGRALGLIANTGFNVNNFPATQAVSQGTPPWSFRYRNPGDTVYLGDATNPVRVDPTGVTTQPVSVTNFPTTATTSAISIRCVDITGTVFEACGGGGGGGGTVAQGNAGTNAQAWWVQIGDTTNGPVAVKAASTAAVAADKALVVAVSPNNSVAVTGTFWQTTQPVSLAAGVDVTDRAARLLGVISAGTNRIGAVRLVDSADADLTSAKATQTTRAVGVQELRDAGRTLVSIWAEGAVPILSTDTIVTVSTVKGDTLTAGVTTYAITSGKTLRLMGLSFSLTPTSTTVAKLNVRLRTNASAACTVAASTVIGTWAISSPPGTLANNAGGPGVRDVSFNEGIELSGASRNVCLSMSAFGAAAQAVTINLWGYEY